MGQLLRQYQLDELPQLLNVLRGKMNIVGPRAERPTIFAVPRERIAKYPLRRRASRDHRASMLKTIPVILHRHGGRWAEPGVGTPEGPRSHPRPF